MCDWWRLREIMGEELSKLHDHEVKRTMWPIDIKEKCPWDDTCAIQFWPIARRNSWSPNTVFIRGWEKALHWRICSSPSLSSWSVIAAAIEFAVTSRFIRAEGFSQAWFLHSWARQRNVELIQLRFLQRHLLLVCEYFWCHHLFHARIG